jgi:hypothetical protein
MAKRKENRTLILPIAIVCAVLILIAIVYVTSPFSTNTNFSGSCITQQQGFQCTSESYSNGTLSFALSQSTNETLYNAKVLCLSNATTPNILNLLNTTQTVYVGKMNPVQQYTITGVQCTRATYSNGFYTNYLWIAYTQYNTTINSSSNPIITKEIAEITHK